MADNIDFSRFAGHVLFPRNPADLLSTSQCPACFAPLTSSVCASCQLDLRHPAAAELQAASADVAEGLDRRLALIGKIRYETQQAAAQALATQQTQAQAQAQQAAASAAAPAAIPAPAPIAPPAVAQETPALPTPAVQAPPVAPPVVSPAASTGAPAPQITPPTATPRKHSSVQVTLLIVGISLLSVAAIFFLIYAFINFGIVWRSTIIAAITIAAISTASLLRRRNLTATAEGIAVFSVVLIYLDAFALRENDFFGLAGVDGATYWGTTLVVSAIAFLVWHRISALRVPSIVGFSAFAPGVGLLTSGLVQNGDRGTHAFLVVAAIAAAGLLLQLATKALAPTLGHRGSMNAEWVISLSTTALALLSGFFIAFAIDPSSDWSASIAFVALAALTLAHLWAMKAPTATQPVRAFTFIFAGMGGVLAAGAAGIAVGRIESDVFAMTVPTIAAVAVALSLEAIATRGAIAWRRLSTTSALAATGVVMIVIIAPVFFVAAMTVLRALTGFSPGLLVQFADALQARPELERWSVVTLAVVGVMATLAWASTGVIRKRAPLLMWFAAGILVAAAALPTEFWLNMTGWLVLATAAMTLISVPRLRARMGVAHSPLVGITLAGGALGYLVSWASTSTWWIGSLVGIALLLAARRLTHSNGVKALLIGIATALTLIVVGAAPHHLLLEQAIPSDIDLLNGIRFVTIAAVALVAFAAVPLGKTVTRVDRRVVLWMSGAVAALSLTTLQFWINALSEADRAMLFLPEYATTLYTALLLLAAIVLWLTLRPVRSLRPERIVAALATAPALYFAFSAAIKLVVLPDLATAIAPISSALLIAAAALTVTIVKPHLVPRWALDTGVVLVAVPALLYTVAFRGEFAWLVLLIAAVATLLLAVSNDGLFSSTSPRRHLVWLAIALATAGLWWRLGSSRVDALEPYVLPLTGILLATALGIARAEFRKSSRSPGGTEASVATKRSAAPLVALGGLVVTVLPLSINAVNGSLTRAIVVGASSAALLLAGSLLATDRPGKASERVGIRWQPWLDVAALAGAVGVIVLAFSRAGMTSPSEWSRDVWVGAAFIVLVAAGIGQTRIGRASGSRLRSVTSQVLTIVPMAAVLVVESVSLDTPGLGMYRALGLVVLFATITALCFTLDRTPFSRTVGWFSTAFWAIASVMTLVRFTNELLPSLTPIITAFLVAAVALTVALTTAATVPRWTREMGAIVVGALTTLLIISQDARFGWIILLIAAVTVLLLAIDKDGLFSSPSGRRHLGWVALALATAGLWWRLTSSRVDAIEPYVLPLAAVLFIIAVLVQRAYQAKPEGSEHQPYRAAALIALGGATVALLPLAVNAASGETTRAVIIAVVSAILLLAGSFVIGSRAAQPWWDATALSGALGVIVLLVGRATFLPVADTGRDAWIVGGFVCLVAAAFGQARLRKDTPERLRSLASQALGIFAMVAVLALSIPAFQEPPANQIRILLVVLVFAVVHVLALTLRQPPFTLLVGWIAIALAAIAAAAALWLEAIDAPELVTVPIALSLLAAGSMHLRDVAAARSWLWLAPGVSVLLVPSLVETFSDQSLWRMVGVGVAGIAIIVIGVVRRLQAPFTIGVIVVLIHAVATFLPQLRAAYEFMEWWMWLGIGGVLITVLAARYEQRIRNFKDVAMKFASLR